jgi:formylglycine-generating enzyme
MRFFCLLVFLIGKSSLSDIEPSSCGCSGSDGLSRENNGFIGESVKDGVYKNLQGGQIEKDMVYVEGGSFMMGTDNPVMRNDGETPSRKITLSSFLIDKYEVTNYEYSIFVNNTSYVTESELFGW